MTKWILLSGDLYMFGQGGVIRILEYSHYLNDGKKSSYNSTLYTLNGQVGTVKETVKEIEEMLNG